MSGPGKKRLRSLVAVRVTVCLGLLGCLRGNISQGGEWTKALIAHYPLETNGLDGIDRSSPFVVDNVAQQLGNRSYSPTFVIRDPPFTQRVLYVDGRYEANSQ